MGWVGERSLTRSKIVIIAKRVLRRSDEETGAYCIVSWIDFCSAEVKVGCRKMIAYLEWFDIEMWKQVS